MPQAYSIVGDKFVGATEILKAMKAGEKLVLVREPDNKYDANAVMVWWNNRHVGYVPKAQNAVLAKYIDEHGAACEVPPRPGETIAADSAPATRPSIEATFARSPNSGFPMAEVA